MRQEQQTEAKNPGFDISAGDLAERFILALVTGIGIAVGAWLLSFVWPVVTANRFAQVRARHGHYRGALNYFIQPQPVDGTTRR